MVYKLYIFFEYDESKSLSNKVKHGIDFEESKKLWEDEKLLQIQANSFTEPRFLLIGLLDDSHWSAVITYRGERIRIISVRRSSKVEVTLYEKEKN